MLVFQIINQCLELLIFLNKFISLLYHRVMIKNRYICTVHITDISILENVMLI